jgi:tyrosine-protein kinase
MSSPHPNPAPHQGSHIPYLRAVRAHWLLVAAIVFAAVVAAVTWQKARARSYAATAQVLVAPVSNGGPYVGLPVVTEASNFPSRMLQTATSVLKSPAAASATATRIPGHWSQKRVSESIAVQPLGESNIVSITGTASSPSQAATLANVYARQTLSLHLAQLINEAKVEIGQLQERQRSLAAGEAGQLSAQLTALASVAAGHDPNFSLLQSATLPTSASGSSTKLIALLALLAGLLVAVGAATLIEYLNRRVRDEDEVLSIYPLPVLSRIPVVARARDATSFRLIPPRVREVFRTLQVQLPLYSPTSGRAVMFTSASARDGKTTSAIDFAVVLADAGFRVILFDLDLRKPEIGERLGAYSKHAAVAGADLSLEELLAEVPSVSGLRVVASRPQGDIKPLLELTGRRLPELVREAREAADYVIVDTPPVGQVSDALRVARAVDDTIVLVVRAGNTHRDELKHTRELLDRMALTPTGMLLIGDTEGGGVYAEYGRDISTEPIGRAMTVKSPKPAVERGTTRVAQSYPPS